LPGCPHDGGGGRGPPHTSAQLISAAGPLIMRDGMSIADALCRELGSYRTPELPEDTGKPGWSKHFVCVFCGSDGKKTAAINYRINYYKCFRCGHDVSAGRYHDRVWISETREWADHIVPAGIGPVSRYRAQINQAARNINGKYGAWAPEWAARDHARLRVLIYAGPPDVNDADAGQLPAWEDKAQFDFNEVDRYVLRALNCDLLDWAKARVRRGRYVEGRVSFTRDVIQQLESPDLQTDGNVFPISTPAVDRDLAGGSCGRDCSSWLWPRFRDDYDVRRGALTAEAVGLRDMDGEKHPG
jgi:hypothetical protein